MKVFHFLSCGDMCSNSNAPCGSSLTCAIGNVDIGSWAGLSNDHHEKTAGYVVGPDAGVLCCATSTSSNKLNSNIIWCRSKSESKV